MNERKNMPFEILLMENQKKKLSDTEMCIIFVHHWCGKNGWICIFHSNICKHQQHIFRAIWFSAYDIPFICMYLHWINTSCTKICFISFEFELNSFHHAKYAVWWVHFRHISCVEKIKNSKFKMCCGSVFTYNSLAAFKVNLSKRLSFAERRETKWL